MAEILESFEFRMSPRGSLHKWLDGKIYKLEIGKDINAKSVDSARANLAVVAKRLGGTIRCNKIDDTHIVVQFYKPSENGEK